MSEDPSAAVPASPRDADTRSRQPVETIADPLTELETLSKDLLLGCAREGTLEQHMKKSELDELAKRLIEAELAADGAD